MKLGNPKRDYIKENLTFTLAGAFVHLGPHHKGYIMVSNRELTRNATYKR